MDGVGVVKVSERKSKAAGEDSHSEVLGVLEDVMARICRGVFPIDWVWTDECWYRFSVRDGIKVRKFR